MAKKVKATALQSATAAYEDARVKYDALCVQYGRIKVDLSVARAHRDLARNALLQEKAKAHSGENLDGVQIHESI